MPVVALVGTNGPILVTGIVSGDFAFAEGPPPGFINATFVMLFTGVPFVGVPNVVASTGNPHWTAHPIWINPGGAGFVVNRKTPSPGNRTFSVYALAMGPLGTVLEGESAEIGCKLREVTSEEFQALAQEAGVEWMPDDIPAT